MIYLEYTFGIIEKWRPVMVECRWTKQISFYCVGDRWTFGGQIKWFKMLIMRYGDNASIHIP